MTNRSWQKIPNLRESIKNLPETGRIKIRSDEWPIVGRKPCPWCNQPGVIYRGKQDLIHYCHQHGRLSTRAIEQQRLLLDECVEGVAIIGGDSVDNVVDSLVDSSVDNRHKAPTAAPQTLAAVGADNNHPRVTRTSVLQWLLSLPVG